MVYAAIAEKVIQTIAAPHVRRCRIPLQQVLERPCGRRALQQRLLSSPATSNRTRPLGMLGARGHHGPGRIRGVTTNAATNAQPPRDDSRRVSLDLRDSSRRLPGPDRRDRQPGSWPNSDGVRTSVGSPGDPSISSSASFMAGDYRSSGARAARKDCRLASARALPPPGCQPWPPLGCRHRAGRPSAHRTPITLTGIGDRAAGVSSARHRRAPRHPVGSRPNSLRSPTCSPRSGMLPVGSHDLRRFESQFRW